MRKPKYAVTTSITGKEVTVARGNVNLKIKITNKHLEIEGLRGHFVFKSTNEAKTVKRWDEVIGCLQMAVKEIKKQRKL